MCTGRALGVAGVGQGLGRERTGHEVDDRRTGTSEDERHQQRVQDGLPPRQIEHVPRGVQVVVRIAMAERLPVQEREERVGERCRTDTGHDTDDERCQRHHHRRTRIEHVARLHEELRIEIRATDLRSETVRDRQRRVHDQSTDEAEHDEQANLGDEPRGEHGVEVDALEPPVVRGDARGDHDDQGQNGHDADHPQQRALPLFVARHVSLGHASLLKVSSRTSGRFGIRSSPCSKSSGWDFSRAYEK